MLKKPIIKSGNSWSYTTPYSYHNTQSNENYHKKNYERNKSFKIFTHD